MRPVSSYATETESGEGREVMQTDDPKAKVGYWLKWIKDEKAQHKKMLWDYANLAWCEYEKGDRSQYASEDALQRLEARPWPQYWSAINTLAPAYYSKNPDLYAKRRFDLQDKVALTGAKFHENIAERHLEGPSFKTTMQTVVKNVLNTSMGITRVEVEESDELITQVIPLVQQGDQFIRQDGQPWAEEVFQNPETGELYGEEQRPDYSKRKVYCSAVTHDRILWNSEATCFEEITDIAYFKCIPEKQALGLFGAKAKPALRQKKDNQRTDENDSGGEVVGQDKFLSYWEIWCLDSKRVYCVSEDLSTEFLNEKEDPYGLVGFFPSPPFVVQSQRRASLFGVPAYVHLRPTLEMLHDCFRRVQKLLKVSRVRGVADGAVEGLEALITGLAEGDYLMVTNFADLVQKGGVQNLIQHFPTEKIAQEIRELISLSQYFIGQFHDLFGTPDIIRGQTDPQKAAQTNQIETVNASNRFREDVYSIARLARDTLRLMNDLTLNAYRPEDIKHLVGVRYMEEEHQANADAALQLIMSDSENMVRIDIETDSTSYVHEQMEQQQIAQVGQIVIQGMQQIGAVAQTMPQAVPLLAKVLLKTVASMRKSKDIENDIEAAVQALMQPKPPMPPPPDYEGMKLQLENNRLALKNSELAFKQFKEQADLDLKRMKEGREQDRKDFLARLEHFATMSGVDLDRFNADVNAREAIMEETRLAKEVDAKMIEAQKPNLPEKQDSPAAIIINQAPKPDPVPVPVPVVPPRF